MARDRYGYYTEDTDVRVGITERDVTREHLSWAFANEYITHEEFDNRGNLVDTARTQAALNRIVADLPKFVPPPVPVPVTTRAKHVVEVVNGIHPSFKALAFLPLSASVALAVPISLLANHPDPSALSMFFAVLCICIGVSTAILEGIIALAKSDV